uniref:Uncharacterized protein n=1 Tax=Helianthus annuus TaxID=4232 RepID=A0A251RQT6_HELAN
MSTISVPESLPGPLSLPPSLGSVTLPTSLPRRRKLPLLALQFQLLKRPFGAKGKRGKLLMNSKDSLSFASNFLITNLLRLKLILAMLRTRRARLLIFNKWACLRISR